MENTASTIEAFERFQKRFALLASKNKEIIVNTLSNIFTMRLIGNKTHGDLAEIGIAEFINQFMYDYKSIHVGKDLYRAKEHEEDIEIIDEISKEKFPVSLKAYGKGPLQLSTDSTCSMFNELEHLCNRQSTAEIELIENIFNSDSFSRNFGAIHVMPLIYNESEKECNIMIFDYQKARSETVGIKYEDSGNGRKHPIYKFVNKDEQYIFEVRYGDATANALQRGLWTHTINATPYFKSLTNGWISYSHNQTLVRLFSLALNSTEEGHKEANEILQKHIDSLKCR